MSYQVREFKMNAIIESLPCIVAKPSAYQSSAKIQILFQECKNVTLKTDPKESISYELTS